MSAASVSVVPAVETDLDAVTAIERVVFSDPWSTESFRDAMSNPAIFFGCARPADGSPTDRPTGRRMRGTADGDSAAIDGAATGPVVGYVVAWFVADEGEIANLAVARSGWGAGIGRALLDAALAEGTRRGAATVYLEVRESNARARTLYESRGFDPVGRRRGYYRHPDEDAIVLRLNQ